MFARLCILLCVSTLAVSGCKDAPERKLWAREVDSPDGHYQAFAEARIDGVGYGTDYGATDVWIQQNHDATTKSMIIGLASGEPLQVKWIDNAHLKVSYRPENVSGIDFQAVRCCGVDIALAPLPPGSPKPQ